MNTCIWNRARGCPRNHFSYAAALRHFGLTESTAAGRIIIECAEKILHLKVGYIYADRSFRSTLNLLQLGGGPYIFANNRRRNNDTIFLSPPGNLTTRGPRV